MGDTLVYFYVDGEIVDSIEFDPLPIDNCVVAFAYSTTAQSVPHATSTSDWGSYVTMKWDGEEFDIGNGMNDSSYVAPVDGIYLISATSHFRMDTASILFGANFINDTLKQVVSEFGGTENDPIFAYRIVLNPTFTYYLEKDDVVQFKVFQRSGAAISTKSFKEGTTFSVARLDCAKPHLQ